MEKCAAAVICYNPDIPRLKACIDAAAGQVQKVYCFDNGSANVEEILALAAQERPAGQCVELIRSPENRGIPAAMNEMLRRADEDGMTWLLSLDQDSVAGEGMAEKLVEAILSDESAALACPVVYDGRRGGPGEVTGEERIGETDFCITSGCLMDVRKVLEIGGLDEWLFIDFVDNELCHRVRLNGYKIMQNHAVVLDHELGKITPSPHAGFYRRFYDSTHLPLFQKLTYRREVVPMRVRYATRNCLYLKKKYRKYPNPAFTVRWTVYNGLSSIVRGRKKGKIASAFLQGLKEGCAAKCEACEPVRQGQDAQA